MSSHRVDVIDSIFESGRISFLSHNNNYTQWWMLKLSCGHIVGRYTNMKKASDTPPKRVKCEYCSEDEKAIQRNFDYTSDVEGWAKNQHTGLPLIS